MDRPTPSDSLFDHFDADPRPSMVLNISDFRPVYQNHAFREWQSLLARKGGPSSHETTLDDWYRTLARASQTCQSIHGGINWLVTPQRQSRVIVTSLESPCLAQLRAPSPLADSLPQSLDWTRSSDAASSAHIQLVKQYKWESTELGHMVFWSDTLRHIVLSMMANVTPQILLWGSSRTMIYNEACAPLLGNKHPKSLGETAANVWQEAMVVLDPIITAVETQAKGTKLPSTPVIMHRQDFDEETFWNINFTPVIGSCGKCLGVVDQFTDNTEHMVRERRRKTASDLDAALTPIQGLTALWNQLLDNIRQASADIPYALLYTSKSFGSSASNPKSDVSLDHRLFGSVGIDDTDLLPESFDASTVPAETELGIAASCQRAWQSLSTVSMRVSAGTLSHEFALPCPAQEGSKNTIDTVLCLPIWDVSQKSCLGFLVLAMNPNRPFDETAAHFVEEIGNIIRVYAQTIYFPTAQSRLLQQFEEVEESLTQKVREQHKETLRIAARLEKIFKMAPVGVFSIHPDGRCVFYNDAYCKITGLSEEQLRDPAFRSSSTAHDEDRERVLNIWKNCLVNRTPVSIEYRLKKPWTWYNDATEETVRGETWVYATAACEINDDGELDTVTGFLVDISDRKWHEQQRNITADAERTEAPFKKLAASAPMGMYHLRADGSPIYINDAYFELAGITREYENNMGPDLNWSSHIAKEDVAEIETAWKKLIMEGVPLNLEYRVDKPWRYFDSVTEREVTGPTWLQGTAIADRDAEGRTQSVLGFVTEISSKKFSEKLLAERLEEALETKRQADRFIDMTSHEMRNPLSAILQSADAILTALTEDADAEGDDVVTAVMDPAVLAETVLDATQTIVLCAQHQKRIVDDILTLSKLDTKLLVIVPDKASPVDLLNRSIKMYEAEIRRAEVEVNLEVEQSYHDLALGKVMLDSSRLLQVVINLLTNAVKFTQRSVDRKITIYLGGSESQPTGPFHEAAYIPQKAHRIDPTDSPEWGDGPSAYLQIAVEDSGCGLTGEELKVMFHRFAQASPKTYKQYGGSGLGLFISRELTELQGGAIGVHSVAGKGSTFTFYVKVKRCLSDNTTHDEVDLSSPLRSTSVMSGHKTNSLHPVRSHSATGERRPSLMVAPPGAEPLLRSRSSGLLGLHILVVEDNVINQRVMASQLRRMGCTVHIAHHGAEALQFLGTTTFWDATKAPGPSATMYGAHSDKEQSVLAVSGMHSAASAITPPLTPAIPLSVVLCDCEMPVMDGMATVKEIRRLEKVGHLRRHVPVIAITANARSEQIAAAIHQGMDRVVTKPFRIPDLLPLFEEVLGL